MSSIPEYIDEYLTSEHFHFVTGPVKEYAAELLHHFCHSCKDPSDIQSIEDTFTAMARLDLPLSVKMALPDLVSAYFHYCGVTGKIPSAINWEEHPQLLKQSYKKLFREDGTVRGITYKKNYSPTGRNEPCPCGSGLKFKKCCGKQ